MPEQPDKCMEHHMILKKSLEDLRKEFDELTKSCKDMRCFLFGGISQHDGHLSFVDKVNVLYENQEKSRKLLITFLSVFGVLFITGLIGLGSQLHQLNAVTRDLATYAQGQRAIEIELAEIRTKISR